MVPALVIAFFIAPFILGIFGKSYVAGALVPLRWLIVTGFITIVNYLGSSILFIAKKSTMITIGSLVEAITVLGLVMVWATNVTQIAIAWAIANAAYTVLYCLFAFLALREVGGRWEDLGGIQPVLADTATPAELTATSQLRALNMLTSLAEEQRAADVYWPYYPSMTATQGLFSIAAFRAAERQRRENTGAADVAREARPPGTARPSSEDREHRQAFELLFKMAEQQRTKPDSPDKDLNDFRRSTQDRSKPRQ
jgi:hypothetical protein